MADAHTCYLWLSAKSLQNYKLFATYMPFYM